MADPTRKKSVHIAMIKMEHKNACKKHPKFCDEFIDESRVSWAEGEMRIKAKNSQPPEYADCVLMEEVAEAFNAYSQGKLEQSLQEFAQCGAVILRCMQYVRDEINNKQTPNKKDHNNG